MIRRPPRSTLFPSRRSSDLDIKIALKADASTPYKTVKRVMNELQDMDESHYYMITQLKQQGDE